MECGYIHRMLRPSTPRAGFAVLVVAVSTLHCGRVLDAGAGDVDGSADAGHDAAPADGAPTDARVVDATITDADGSTGEGCPPPSETLMFVSPCSWTGVCQVSFDFCSPFLVPASCDGGTIVPGDTRICSPVVDVGTPEASTCPPPSEVRTGVGCDMTASCEGVVSCDGGHGDVNGLCACTDGVWACDASECAGNHCFVGAKCASSVCSHDGTGPCGSGVLLSCIAGTYVSDGFPCVNVPSCEIAPADAGPDGGPPCTESCRCTNERMICACTDGGM